MARVSDARARQFWDPNHLVAAALNEMVKVKPPQPQPACCFDRGFYWDDAILYPPATEWEAQPAPRFWNGPIIRAITPLEESLAQQP